ncbi:MAG TPA: phytanoyl-CoA dioxygenase family protein [Candidatus Methylacidiphilales bacterium]|nr:phytanoyl-CoA dioxygenase family protein [Candidatus Methylacidiphilales bacterium]
MNISTLDQYTDSNHRGLVETNTGSLTEEQRREYDREGYIVLPGLLTQEDMAPIREAIHTKVSQIADELLRDGLISDKLENEPFQTRLAKLFKGKTDQEFLKYGRSWRDLLPGYFMFMSNPKIIDAVESLIGPEIFANPVYNTRPKVPGVAAGAVPWHQDRSYWPNANWNPVITVWIPLVDTNEINGCLHVWPRTHKTRLISYHPDTHTGTAYTELDLKEEADRNGVALPMTAGDAILFNDRCIHSSTPNRSEHVRWSVDLRYQPTDQERMDQYGVGFLARSRQFPQRVATLEDWLAKRPEHQG